MAYSLLEDDEMFLTDRIEIYPNDYQKELIWKNINVSRYIYNWAIEKEYESLNSGKGFIKKYDLCKEFVTFRNKTAFIKEIPSHNCRYGIDRAVRSFEAWLRKRGNQPKYHSKKYENKSFNIDSEHFYIYNNTVYMTGFFECPIKCQPRDYIKSDRFYRITVKVDNIDRYWVTVAYKIKKQSLDTPKSKAIGIDLGCRKDNSNTIVCSNGVRYCQPNTEKLERRLKRQCRKCQKDYDRRKDLARQLRTKVDDIPVSNRAKKRSLKRNKTYAKIHNVKKTFYDQSIADIIKRNPEAIVMEDLRVEELKIRNGFINYEHVSIYYIINHTRNKCMQYNIPFIQAAKGYASSQICSRCGHKRKPGTGKVYRCPNCGLVIDRDDNASINLRNLYYVQ